MARVRLAVGCLRAVPTRRLLVVLSRARRVRSVLAVRAGAPAGSCEAPD